MFLGLGELLAPQEWCEGGVPHPSKKKWGLCRVWAIPVGRICLRTFPGASLLQLSELSSFGDVSLGAFWGRLDRAQLHASELWGKQT